jgi:hypothetical protein
VLGDLHDRGEGSKGDGAPAVMVRGQLRMVGALWLTGGIGAAAASSGQHGWDGAGMEDGFRQ